MIVLITGITLSTWAKPLRKTIAQKDANVVKDCARHKAVYATAVGDITKAYSFIFSFFIYLLMNLNSANVSSCVSIYLYIHTFCSLTCPHMFLHALPPSAGNQHECFTINIFHPKTKRRNNRIAQGHPLQVADVLPHRSHFAINGAENGLGIQRPHGLLQMPLIPRNPRRPRNSNILPSAAGGGK